LAARQALLNNDLPLVTTQWQTESIGYREEAYATMLDVPLNDAHLRGDEPSVLLLRLNARNLEAERAEAQVWLQVSPPERMVLKDGLLLGTANEKGTYASPRLRASLSAAEGTLEIRELPPSAGARVETPKPLNREGENPTAGPAGSAVLWRVSLPAQGSAVLDIKIPFRTMVDLLDQQRVKQIRFETRQNETFRYWNSTMAQGMSIQVPDAEL